MLVEVVNNDNAWPLGKILTLLVVEMTFSNLCSVYKPIVMLLYIQLQIASQIQRVYFYICLLISK